MNKVALYRKYRSQDFSELIGQNHIAETLSRAIKNDRISHAYLFTGPRGTGKTSTARIFARHVNQIEDSRHEVDIIEIDAASNNGVEEIRELREKVHIAPNYCRYKVYIIDEVHMLSNAAFNALLKTLEEPPAHAIFILATTEPHKLPKTIASRTQHFPFRPVPHTEVASHLRKIADTENVKIDDEALNLIAELGEGSVRDAISLLDQLAGKDTAVDANFVRSMVGVSNTEHIKKLVQATIEQKPSEVLALLDESLSSGLSLRSFVAQILDVTRRYIRDHIQDADIKLHNAKRLLQSLSSVPGNTPHLDVAIESALLSVSHGKTPKSPGRKAENFQARVKQPKSLTGVTTMPVEKQPLKAAAAHNPNNPKAADNMVWVKALSIIKERHSHLYGILRNADMRLSDGDYVITAKFQFHYRRLQEQRNYSAIKQAIAVAGGGDHDLKIGIESGAVKTGVSLEDDRDKVINQVFDILGGELV